MHIDQLCSMPKLWNATLGPDTPPQDFPFHALNPFPDMKDPKYPKHDNDENSRYLLRVGWVEGCMIDNGEDRNTQRVAQPGAGSNRWDCWNIVTEFTRLASMVGTVTGKILTWLSYTGKRLEPDGMSLPIILQVAIILYFHNFHSSTFT